MFTKLIANRNFCQTGTNVKTIMKYLNVAEKNDAAKTIAGHLSNGTASRVLFLLLSLRRRPHIM